MADRIIVYWRDIPAQVIVKAGRKAAQRELPERFIEAIDALSLSCGGVVRVEFIDEWRRGA